MIGEQSSPVRTGTHAAFAAMGFFLACLTVFAYLLNTSGHPYLLGGDPADWCQVAGAIGIFCAAFLFMGEVLWGLLRVLIRRTWTGRSGAIAATFAGVWLVFTLLRFAPDHGLLPPDYALVPALAVTGLLMLMLGWLCGNAFSAVALVASFGTLSGIVVLALAARFFIFEAHRVYYSSMLAIAYAATVTAIGLLILAVTGNNQRRFLCTLGAIAPSVALPAAALLALLPALPPEVKPTQVVLVSSDALRADFCSVYGGQVPTPNMEAMAAEGTVFDRYYSLAPWTSPSFCGLFSSKYPMSMTPGNTNEQWADVLGRNPDVMDYWLDDDQTSYIERLDDHGFVTGAFLGNTILGAEQWLLRGFDYRELYSHRHSEVRGPFWRVPPLQAVAALAWPESVQEHPIDSTRILRQRAANFIRKHRRQNFFLWVHLMDPHAPYDPPERYRSRTGDFRLFYPSKGLYGSPTGDDLRAGNVTADQKNYIQSLYESEIRYVDETLGLLTGTARRWTKENASVIFLSDHGEEFWDHGQWSHGQSLYNELLRVPLIITGPNVVHQRVATPMSGLDILPTLAHLCGMSPRDEWKGRSFFRVLRGHETLQDDRPLYAQGTSIAPEPLRAIISENLKLVEGLTSANVELYHQTDDPHEQTNLAPSAPQQVDQLLEALSRWVESFPSLITDFAASGEEDPAHEEMMDRMRGLGYL